MHKLILAKHLHEAHHGSSRAGRFNAAVAVRASAVLSSMYFFWFCVLLDLFELPSVVHNPTPQNVVTYLSQVVIQLLALPLLGAYQAIISKSQDARAETDHETLVVLHQLNKQQLEILQLLNERRKT